MIIPCYNQARFLGEAIESVLNQAYQDFEILVVNDGATDNTSDVAARYPNIRCIEQCNQGQPTALNNGFSQSKGQYIVFLDADDRLLPTSLQWELDCLSSHPECAFVYGHVKLIAHDGTLLPTPEQLCVEKDHYLKLLRMNYIWTYGVAMYRRSVLGSVGGFAMSNRGSSDFDLNLRIARRFPICCINESVLEYRMHIGSMSCNNAVMLKSSIAACRSQWKYIFWKKNHRQALKAGIRQVHSDYGEKLASEITALLRARDFQSAIKGSVVLLRYYPLGFVNHAFRFINNGG